LYPSGTVENARELHAILRLKVRNLWRSHAGLANLDSFEGTNGCGSPPFNGATLNRGWVQTQFLAKKDRLTIGRPVRRTLDAAKMG